MTQYFTVFTKHGIKKYENGAEPKYLHALIRSLDPTRNKFSRCVQNEYVFVESRFDIVYLGVYRENDENQLSKDIQQYEDSLQEITDKLKNEKNKGEKKTKDNTRDKIAEYKKENVKNASNSIYSISSKLFTKNSLIPDKFSVGPVKKIQQRLSFSLFSRNIYREDLRPRLEERLLSKNVASKITKNIVNSVLSQCPDKITEKTCLNLLRTAISKLIHGTQHEELLSQIRSKTAAFVFCFVGVNGVGKSTSLAKVCCWLLQNSLRVFIAACDTFRAGAIEQLKVHVDAFRLAGYDVGFFEKGYAKDDAGVARQAIEAATAGNYDVVLIDTAGRMHCNSALMSSLSKLMRNTSIDHIIYVGEALIGNDSLEHLQEFNAAIKAGNSSKRIDSLFITKVDAVEEKIGQILNMCVCADCPVLFLGTGQTNTSVSLVDTDIIADSLLSN